MTQQRAVALSHACSRQPGSLQAAAGTGSGEGWAERPPPQPARCAADAGLISFLFVQTPETPECPPSCSVLGYACIVSARIDLETASRRHKGALATKLSRGTGCIRALPHLLLVFIWPPRSGIFLSSPSSWDHMLSWITVITSIRSLERHHCILRLSGSLCKLLQQSS